MSLGGVATWSRGAWWRRGDNFPRWIADFIEKSWGRCGKCFAVTCDTCAVATRYGLALVNTYKPPAFHARQERRDARGREGDGGLTAPRSAVSRKHTSTVAQHRLSCLSCSRSRTAHARLERRREYKNQFIVETYYRRYRKFSWGTRGSLASWRCAASPSGVFYFNA